MIAAARVERFLANTLSWSFISTNVGKRFWPDDDNLEQIKRGQEC